jgi:hypothetical protein
LNGGGTSGASQGGPGGHGRAPAQPPPSGAAGLGQQTQAAQLTSFLFAPGFGRPASRPASRTKRGTKRRTKLPAQRRKKRAKRKGRKGARFVKGSAAAKRFMAGLRRKQKRNR